VNRLTQLRTDAGLTALELARQAGVSRLTIANLERGKSAHAPTLKRIADYFGVPASDLQREALPVRDIRFSQSSVSADMERAIDRTEFSLGSVPAVVADPCRRCKTRMADGDCRDRLCFYCREFLDQLADDARCP
jgi:transcriptional regulator with XRE-family HTH domain